MFGLPGVRVERWADGTRVVHAVTASETAAACPSCGGVLHGGEGSGEHLAARHSLRRESNHSAAEQDPLAVPGTLLRTRFLHRVHRAGPGPGADYRAAAHPDRRGDRGCGPLGVGGRHRPRGVVADRAPHVRRPRQGVSGRARTDPGARHRRDPPRKAPLDALRADAAAGEGPSVGHRVRRPGGLPGLARAT